MDGHPDTEPPSSKFNESDFTIELDCGVFFHIICVRQIKVRIILDLETIRIK